MKSGGARYADLSIVGLSPLVGPSGYYRCRHPLRMLFRGGARVAMADEASQPDDCDILLFSNGVHSPRALDLVKALQQRGTRVVYELDDYVHLIPEKFFVNITRREALRPIDYWIQTADALFVSTQALAEVYGPMARRTFVLPNSIDLEIRDWSGIRDWSCPPPGSAACLAGRLVIGYAGSIMHREDWRPIGGALAAVLARHPEAVVSLTGNQELLAAWTEGLALPRAQAKEFGWVLFQHYPKRIGSFDIGLAPLQRTPFTRCKSDLKLLEYGARGIPYIASAVTPYRELHQETEGQGGYVCETPEEWEEALTRLLEDADERRAKGEFMREYVRRERSLEKGAALWAEAFRAVRDG